MKNKHGLIALLILTTAFQYGMARNSAQYDEEARAEEKVEKELRKQEKAAEKESKRHHARTVVSGVKEATVDSAAGLISETAAETADAPPIIGTLEGVRQGSGKVLDKTVRGAAKVATLGYSDGGHYEVEEPKANSGEPTKIKFKIPGT